jgi:hypothetical protein
MVEEIRSRKDSLRYPIVIFTGARSQFTVCPRLLIIVSAIGSYCYYPFNHSVDVRMLLLVTSMHLLNHYCNIKPGVTVPPRRR